ncbi:metal ABC transporter substrate-binding protein [Natrinema salsiterrestre]|uniref:Zinc ABC transporter substrate-binding protein n=1 Tax=Natrinema salsiterrestre TaxID=2950540 RepID=A0A9Q4Q2J3_9EURY|nr:zinc ABC transporter substrate-binding protein [Natrinema salsiterrestre]MDF9746581.1 zinc ABC transporter substrate-binding protein [Natrinema salsiterrestre]
MDFTRRALVKTGAGAVATGALAGCLDDVGGASAGFEDGYAAFFTLWDWAEQVSGDAVDFENPVGTGEAGHGWSPGGDLTREIASSGAFVYLDTAEFSWAQDIAATLEADYDSVTVIDGLAGLEDELLGWDHEVDAGGHDDHNESHDDHGDDNESHDESDEGGHDHDETSIDPHVWLDPVLAQDVVTTIATGLADADPDNAETYEDNAAEYVAGLEDLDRQFEDLIDAADRRVAVFAGHDSFTYLQDRYGFDLHTPVGVSAQDQATTEDMAATIDLIDEEGIETVLYNPFKATDGSYQMVENILEGSNATDAMPITHLSGTLGQWQEKGWGYRDQMEEINLPAFREVLDAQ